MNNYQNQIDALDTLSAPLERFEKEIEEIKEMITIAEQSVKAIAKPYPETYLPGMLTSGDMKEHLNNKIAERDAYFTEMKHSIKQFVSARLAGLA
jgi:hypothetical protein